MHVTSHCISARDKHVRLSRVGDKAYDRSRGREDSSSHTELLYSA